MAAGSVHVSSPLRIAVASGCADSHGVKQPWNVCEARLLGSNRNAYSGALSLKSLRCRSWSDPTGLRRRVSVKAQAGDQALQQSNNWGEGVSLGTALLPPDVDIGKLEALLFQWGNSLTANANLPLPNPLKVDRVKGGVRLGYIRLKNGAVEDLVHIDVLVNPATADSKAYFQATRNGQYKNQVPPGEPLIMQSLLQALRKSIQLARP